MEKIHLIMPMAGGGTRFSECGFNLPKPLIQLKNKPFFYWAVRSLTSFVSVKDITFVVLEDHVKNFNIDKVIYNYYPNATIIVIPNVLNGAVLTCLEGVRQIIDDSPVLFNDCDHAFVSRHFYEYLQYSYNNTIDGAILTFKSNNPNYSYIVFNDKGEIIGTIEKQVASEEAICGAYYFRNKQLFIDAANSYLKKCSYKEFYMSGLYNEMVNNRKVLTTFALDEHISFGTPEEYERANQDNRLEELYI